MPWQSPQEPAFGADEAFERRLARIRRVTWGLVSAALLFYGLQQVGAGGWQASASVRAVIIYSAVWLFLRLAGKRTLGEMTTFDLVIVLLLSEAVQPAMTGDDVSLATGLALCATLVGADVVVGLLRHGRPNIARWIDDVPTVLVYDGRPHQHALATSRVDVDDILEAARIQHGIVRLRDVRYAIMERSGGISIIPWANSPDDVPDLA